MDSVLSCSALCGHKTSGNSNCSSEVMDSLWLWNSLLSPHSKCSGHRRAPCSRPPHLAHSPVACASPSPEALPVDITLIRIISRILWHQIITLWYFKLLWSKFCIIRESSRHGWGDIFYCHVMYSWLLFPMAQCKQKDIDPSDSSCCLYKPMCLIRGVCTGSGLSPVLLIKLGLMYIY